MIVVSKRSSTLTVQPAASSEATVCSFSSSEMVNRPFASVSSVEMSSFSASRP